MKPCSQLHKIGANFHGFTLPVNALYGNVSGVFYVCTNVYGYTVSVERFSKGEIVQMKQKHFPLKIWNGFRYEDATTENYPHIRKYILDYMKTPGFIRERCVYCEHKTQKKIRERMEILSMCPHVKQHPQPQYGAKSGCYSQARVDGRGYNISWEENNDPLELNTHGMDCLWNECQSTHTERKRSIKPSSMNPFEGVTDTDEARRKDGMRVKQIKCRPGKPYIIES